MGRYSSELVGESNYQDAVRRMRVGDPVELVHEPDNRFDDLAVKACDVAGRTLGYVGRGSWLQRVVAEDGTEVFARVRAVIGGEAEKPSVGLVLDVFTAKDAEAARRGQYAKDRAMPEGAAAAQRSGAMGQIVEHRAPVASPRKPKPKGLLGRVLNTLFGHDEEAEATLRRAREDAAQRKAGSYGSVAGSRPGQPIYIKTGPNSFQSCMGCVGVVVLILIALMMIPNSPS